MWGGPKYDEDLNENPFLVKIQNEHQDLLWKCCEEVGWTILVPRQDALGPSQSCKVLDHILTTDHRTHPSTSSDFYVTLSGKNVKLANQQLIVLDDQQYTVDVLFAETFYLTNNGRQMKYIVWCISRPLFTTIVDDLNQLSAILETVHDCIDFLWLESHSHAIFDQLNEQIDEFSRNWTDLELFRESVHVQKELIAQLYTKCLQVALRNDQLCRRCDNAAFFANLKLAVEAYVQQQLGCHGNQLIMSIGAILCIKDANFNKIVQNVKHMNDSDNDIVEQSPTMAQHCLGRINNYLTVLDKLNCLKKTLNDICIDSSCQIGKSHLTSDDTLQSVVNLILAVNVNNWITNLTFLKEFRFSCQNDDDDDSKSEDAYLIATLEAAIEFIKNVDVSKSNKGFQSQVDLENDLDTTNNDSFATLCHPLCTCQKCSKVQLPVLPKMPYNDLLSACRLGNAVLVEKLLRSSVTLSVFDNPAPLLCAAAHGYQDVLLILLQYYEDHNKDINNVKDCHGNTVLHLTVNNGHDCCVKAVIYTVKYLNIVNARNKIGETPLFIAAKWGYIDIINVLLQNGADVNLTNNRGQTVKEIVSNYEILSLLCNNYVSAGRNNHYCKVSVNMLTENSVTDHVTYGVRPKNSSQFKKVDLLLKAISNDDIPLACFYLGFKSATPLTELPAVAPLTDIKSIKCHPLCDCSLCTNASTNSDDIDSIGSKKESVDDSVLNVNICNGNGLTPLHIAAKYGRLSILRLLLDAGANANVQTYKTHYTPLIFATINGHIKVVKELLKCGDCQIDKCDTLGHSALYYACMKNDYKLVEVLVNNGADCGIRNSKTGRTLIQELTDKGSGSAVSQRIYDLVLKRKRNLSTTSTGKENWLC